MSPKTDQIESKILSSLAGKGASHEAMESVKYLLALCRGFESELIEAQEKLMPQPLPAHYVKEAHQMEGTIRHARYWLECGRRAAMEGMPAGEAVMAVEQAMNSWMNQAYASQQKLNEATDELTRVRPKHDAYERVCQTLGIEKDILGEVEKIKLGSKKDGMRAAAWLCHQSLQPMGPYFETLIKSKIEELK